MVEPVGKNNITPADQSRNDAGICRMPAVEEERRFTLFKGSEVPNC